MKIVCWVLAIVFAVAAGLKMGGAVAGNSMFGSLPAAVRAGLVAVELAIAAWLVSGWNVRGAAMGAIVVLSVFLAAIVVELGKPEPADCGCMGTVSASDPAAVRKSLQRSLGMDCAMLLGALGVYFGERAAGGGTEKKTGRMGRKIDGVGLILNVAESRAA